LTTSPSRAGTWRCEGGRACSRQEQGLEQQRVSGAATRWRLCEHMWRGQGDKLVIRVIGWKCSCLFNREILRYDVCCAETVWRLLHGGCPAGRVVCDLELYCLDSNSGEDNRGWGTIYSVVCLLYSQWWWMQCACFFGHAWPLTCGVWLLCMCVPVLLMWLHNGAVGCKGTGKSRV